MKESEFIEKVKKNAKFEAETSEMMHVILDDPKSGIMVVSHRIWTKCYKEATPLFIYDKNGKEVVPPEIVKQKFQEKCDDLFEESWEDVIWNFGEWSAKEDFAEEHYKTRFPKSISAEGIVNIYKDAYGKQWENEYDKHVDGLDSDGYMVGVNLRSDV